jgi:hypothetical protein
MVKLTDMGAQFRLLREDESFPVKEGENIRFWVRTPYGKSVCKGRIVWSNKIEGFPCFSTEFTWLPGDEKAPLLSLMDSSF